MAKKGYTSEQIINKLREAVLSELVREPDGEEATGAELVSNISKKF